MIHKFVNMNSYRCYNMCLIFIWLVNVKAISGFDGSRIKERRIIKLLRSEMDGTPADYTVERVYNNMTNTENHNLPKVLKCCNLNESYTFNNKSCVETDDEFLPDFENLPNYSKEMKNFPPETRYEYYIGDPCVEGKYILDLDAYPEDKYFIFSNGTLFYLNQFYSEGEFCLESLNGTIRVFMCFGISKNEYQLGYVYMIYATGLFISIPCLIATGVIYLSIDMLRDLRGKSLSCHVFCLASGYFVLGLIQIASDKLNEECCIGAGFIIQFFFVAAFFWLNVISYDTWCCIKNDFRCAYVSSSSQSEKKKFMLYSMYAWYGPIILTIVSLIMDFEPAIPENYIKPNFGLNACWFYSNYSALPYFYGPVAVVISVNIIFFIMSAIKVHIQQKNKVKKNLKNQFPHDKIKDKMVSIRLYTKTLHECVYLFCVMGINWAAEVISWAVGNNQVIWLVTDLFNALQGVIIFYLFVVKPRYIREMAIAKWHKLKERIARCDFKSYKDDNDNRESRHWHANIYEEIKSCMNNENEGFLMKTSDN